VSALRHVPTPPGVAPGNGYSHVVSGRGRLVAVAGQVALDEHGAVVGVGDPEAQARQAFENLRWCLAAAGAGFADVVKLGVFVTDMAHLPALRAARDAVVDTTRPPASTAVQVAALARPEFLIEVDALAVVAD
jgi:enamine deaminase RidA (YjgF/YER057c/UK114 family)